MNANTTIELTQFLFEMTTKSEREWLENKTKTNVLDLMTAFVAAPRFLSKKNISYDDKAKGNLIPHLPGYQVDGWSLVRLAFGCCYKFLKIQKRNV
ncbi:hypothetical protein [Leptospira bourretii]|uniref:hypothetical protein n=1 Tax=Leptospira bourretii TaxID=2484962 RepID=UPI001FEDF5F5|nr:hypothetical protein [Leptospira bourretii]